MNPGKFIINCSNLVLESTLY